LARRKKQSASSREIRRSISRAAKKAADKYLADLHARLFATIDDEQIASSLEIPDEPEVAADDERRRRGRGKAQHSLDLIDAAYTILEEIQPASVRAVCYRLFVEELIRNMGVGECGKVSKQLVYAREHEIIPWEWIVDDSRPIRGHRGWDDPAALIEAALAQYRKNYWQFQPYHVEVWTEKATITSTIDPVLDLFGVRSRVMKGFGSASAIRDAAQFAVYSDKPCHALYVGDWDPSGMFMSVRDLPRRLLKYGDPWKMWTIQRIALTGMDVTAGDVPSFSASEKEKDPRHYWYCNEFEYRDDNVDWDRDRCWELDALSPVRLRDRVRLHIQLMLDDAAWARCQATEAIERESLQSVLGSWNDLKSVDGLLLDTVRKMQPVRTPVPA